MYQAARVSNRKYKPMFIASVLVVVSTFLPVRAHGATFVSDGTLTVPPQVYYGAAGAVTNINFQVQEYGYGAAPAMQFQCLRPYLGACTAILNSAGHLISVYGYTTTSYETSGVTFHVTSITINN